MRHRLRHDSTLSGMDEMTHSRVKLVVYNNDDDDDDDDNNNNNNNL